MPLLPEGEEMSDQTVPETIKPEWLPDAPLSWFRIESLLRQIVESKPDDYTYPRRTKAGPHGDKACAYWHSEDSEPGCLIGHLMFRLGAPADFLNACDRHPGGSGIEVLHNHKIVSDLFDDEAVMVLTYIQGRQDSGSTWAQALKLGIAYFSGTHAMMRKLGKRELERKM